MGVCMEFDNHIKHPFGQGVVVKEFRAKLPASLQVIVHLSERIADLKDLFFCFMK